MINTSSDILSLPKHQELLAHAYIVEGIDINKRLTNMLGLAKSLLCQMQSTHAKSEVGNYNMSALVFIIIDLHLQS